MIRTIAIAGVGLIGGSFALALRKAGFPGRILGTGSLATLEAARHAGLIDEGLPLGDAVAQADVTLLCWPVLRNIAALPEVAVALRPGALVTDVGSTKVAIMRQAELVFPTPVFLGGHPMAGKTARGPAAADAELFRGRPWLLTPASPIQLFDPLAMEWQSLLQSIGAAVRIVSADEHDQLVANSSHVPQLVSTALSAALAAHPECAELAGPGLRDMTRLAQSSWDLWSDIIATNRENVRAGLQQCIRQLQAMEVSLDDSLDSNPADIIEQQFRRGAEFAARIPRP
jgi:prephenate dehydrogenase